MSYESTSSRSSSVSTSSSTMSASRPIDFPSSYASSTRSSFSSSSSSTTFGSPYSSCAYPSWPKGGEFQRSKPSAYVSDEDLFGDDDDAYLSEPPPPPRPAAAYLARPLLPPCLPVKPRTCSTSHKTSKRRSSSTKAKE